MIKAKIDLRKNKQDIKAIAYTRNWFKMIDLRQARYKSMAG